MGKSEKKMRLSHSDSFEMEESLNRESFGHDIPEKIEIEPFSHPSVALQNARLLEKIKRKQ